MYKDIFKHFYCWGGKLWIEGLPACEGETALKPLINITHTCDMNSYILGIFLIEVEVVKPKTSSAHNVSGLDID